jgi:phosphoribosylformylglycinamidine cyclo-ligase
VIGKSLGGVGHGSCNTEVDCGEARSDVKKHTYSSAGVDLRGYGRLMTAIKGELRRSSESSGGGLFAGVLELKGRADRILVASVDGVGTKVKVAAATGWHVGVGRDIVAHCVNDILCAGARPVAFMDYIAFEKLEPRIFRQVLRGIAHECRRFAIQLIGGETAEMPGVYRKGEYDLVGFIIGETSKRKMLDGLRIRKGDLIVGLPSNGLHTNGYSLARRILFDKRRLKVDHRPKGWRLPLGKALLRPHTNYFEQVYPLIEKRLVSGVAHITGGGIAANLTRILPTGCGAVLKRSLWRVPKIFELIAASGPVDDDEMFRVFNMGMGMLLTVSHSNLPEVMRRTRSTRVVGEIVKGGGDVAIE